MPEKKKQHFVPKFYLRNFGLAESDKLISLFHIPNGRYVPKASIGTQACEDNFYKDIEIEDGLGDLEKDVAPVIASTIASSTPPARSSKGHVALLMFALIQAARTRAAIDEMEEQMEKLLKNMIGKEKPELAGQLDQVAIHMDHAPILSVVTSARSFRFGLDLRYKLLCNRTAMPFITSDNPAVRYNQFLETRKREGGITGLTTKGLQIFLPLGSRQLLMFFDEGVYKVGGRKLTNLVADVTHEGDVESLNLLQAVSADEHLYFDGTFSARAARDLVRKAARFRRAERSTLREYENITVQGKQGSLLHMYRNDIRMHLRLRCVIITPQALNYEHDGSMAYVRNRPFRNLLRRFDDEVAAGRYRIDQIPEFLKDSGVLG